MLLITIFLLFLSPNYLYCQPSSEKSLDDTYLLGVGIADVTGPAAEVNMMGYAKFGQDTGGIHFRLFSRAFIIEDTQGNRVVFVSTDACMIDQAIKTQVVARLKEKYGHLYGTDNVLISGTHTHSGPGGFLQYLLYTVTAQGFNWQSFNAIVDGIVRSITRAHSCIKKGHIYYNKGILLNASINRSPTAYLNNSLEERSKYEHDTDKEMHLLKFVDTKNQPLGMITWFAVHPTSMNNTNSLISGDNKGYASLLTEIYINNSSNKSSLEEPHLPGHGPFVAAFAATNLGDVSPNIKGPHCADTGLPCDIQTSTCGNKNANCFAVGPGNDMFESTKIIGERQFNKAIELFESATEKVSGPVKYVHQHVDMTKVEIELPNGTIARTCKPAMGYSFAAGTIDGPGAFDFKQGTTTPNTFWTLVRDFISKPSQEMIDCHQPKPILLSTGQMNFPYPWQPSIVPLQIIQIGNIVIPAAPGELTTMSGRRLRSAIGKVMTESTANLIPDGSKTGYHVILAGLSNAYSSYVATYEEYQIQRYEGASTIYGPYTLDAYIRKFVDLAHNLVDGTTPDPGPYPPNLLNSQISLRPGVILDTAPPGKHFGDCILQPEEEYKPGSTVVVKFISGHPRNDLMSEKSYLTVERVNDSIDPTNFQVIATDSSFETKFFWKRTNSILGTSEAIITWEIPLNTEKGFYRIRHCGASKNFLQHIKTYSGLTNVFEVLGASK